ncbi:MAG: sulfurtransferase TusA family protein [Candidatus Nitrosocaldus sp.]
MSSEVSQDVNVKTIDVRGLFCPEPVFRTKIAMERLSVGSMLKVIADDPDAEEDIKRWVQRTGHELINLSKDGNNLIFLIRKK